MCLTAAVDRIRPHAGKGQSSLCGRGCGAGKGIADVRIEANVVTVGRFTLSKLELVAQAYIHGQLLTEAIIVLNIEAIVVLVHHDANRIDGSCCRGAGRARQAHQQIGDGKRCARAGLAG